MNLYDLVFSDKRSVRFRRHLLFWSAWCIYLAVTWLIPTNWIPAWNLHGPMPHIEKYGITRSIIRILMIESLIPYFSICGIGPCRFHAGIQLVGINQVTAR